jgi:hypothetical protein
MSTIKVDNLDTRTGTGNITLNRPLVGDGSGLTSLTAANLTGTLPAIDGSNLTGVAPTKATVEALGIDVPAANLTGTVADARISTLTSSKLTGALPAISGASLTGLPASVASYVQFPATQVNSTDANRLDEYEEGTWTVSLTCGSGTATIQPTGNYRTAGYIRIGREIFIHGFPYVTAVSSPSGTLDVYGLPFAAGYNLGHTCHLPFNINSTIVNGPIPSGVCAYTWQGNSYMRVVLNGSSFNTNTAQYLTVGSYIYLGGSYYTSSN